MSSVHDVVVSTREFLFSEARLDRALTSQMLVAIAAFGMPLAGALAGFSVFSATRLVSRDGIDLNSQKQQLWRASILPVFAGSLFSTGALTLSSIVGLIIALEHSPGSITQWPLLLACIVWFCIWLVIIPMLRLLIAEIRYSVVPATEFGRFLKAILLPTTHQSLVYGAALGAAVLLIGSFRYDAPANSVVFIVMVLPFLLSLFTVIALLYATGNISLYNQFRKQKVAMAYLVSDKGVLLEYHWDEKSPWNGRVTFPREDWKAGDGSDLASTCDRLLRLMMGKAAGERHTSEIEKFQEVAEGKPDIQWAYFQQIGVEARPDSHVFQVLPEKSVALRDHSMEFDSNEIDQFLVKSNRHFYWVNIKTEATPSQFRRNSYRLMIQNSCAVSRKDSDSVIMDPGKALEPDSAGDGTVDPDEHQRQRNWTSFGGSAYSRRFESPGARGNVLIGSLTPEPLDSDGLISSMPAHVQDLLISLSLGNGRVKSSSKYWQLKGRLRTDADPGGDSNALYYQLDHGPGPAQVLRKIGAWIRQ